MKKILLFFIIFFASSIILFSQVDSSLKKQTLHGVVKNEKNKPIQNATVIVEGEQKGVVTDSLGYFKIDARPNAVLIINADGYESLLKEVNSKELVQAVLAKTKSQDDNSGSSEILKQQTLSNSFQDFGRMENGTIYHGSSLPVIHQNEETKGSRYFFKDWVRGTVINDKGETVSDEYCLFNYDKISHALLVTKDKKSMIQVNYSDVQSFTLKDQGGEYVFSKNPLINGKDFFIQLVKPRGKYSLYKSVKTNFVKSDYRSDGLVESGKNYDEYVDENDYYIVSASWDKYKTVDLKKKSIKEALQDDKDKVNSYFSQHKDDFINESFLIGLINSLNQ